MDTYENRVEICEFIVGKARHALAAARERFQADLSLDSEGSWHHFSVLWHSTLRSREHRTDLAKSIAGRRSQQGVGNALVLEDCVQDFITAIYEAMNSVDSAWDGVTSFVSKKRKRSARDVLLKAVGLPVETVESVETASVASEVVPERRMPKRQERA
eukprot:6484877-Amphidinium_carterae.1